MAAKLNMFSLLALATVALFQSYALAATYEVGDSTGWSIPTGGSATYSTWAANKNFKVGDTLVFKFGNGQHDVAKVNKAAYDSCSASNTISIQKSSPANIRLESAGQHYFICTFGGHCSAGQKLAINVGGASSPTPQPSSSPISPAPQPNGTATPPSTSTPPSSSANPPSTSTTSPPPSASTTPSSPSPSGVASPPENSASSVGFAGLSATLLSIAFALCY